MNMKKESKISVTLWLDPDILERLDSYAELSGESRSQAVRELLSEGLTKYEELFAYMQAKAEADDE